MHETLSELETNCICNGNHKPNKVFCRCAMETILKPLQGFDVNGYYTQVVVLKR